MKTLQVIAGDLADGRSSSRGLVEEALEALERGVAARAFLTVDGEGARAAADHHDAARKAGRAVSAFAGIPFGVKDLFDVAGEVTAAGSVVLAGAKPAETDSDAVSRMRQAGFIPLGRTNMTEFAYSGVGLNPHHGTPHSVWPAEGHRIPGGSSSGSGVAVGAGVVPVALGTDTGGSCRIPAAFNGIVGFKPSANAVSKRGVFPLSPTLDSVGPLGVSVGCCADLFNLLRDRPAAPAARPSRPMRLAVLQTVAMTGLDESVSADFTRTCEVLQGQGVEISDVMLPELDELPQLLANGGLVGAEAYGVHAAMLEKSASQYDPRVSSRIALASVVSETDVARIRQRRNQIIQQFTALALGYDAVICPTVAVVPPAIEALSADDDYRRINGLCLRNTALFNFLDGCSISVPIHRAGSAPVGLMLSAAHGRDSHLLYLAGTVARFLSAAH